MSKYESWTLVQLKDELRKRKAKISGRKKELIERLSFYDANFAHPEPDPAEYKMILPDPTKYKDVNGGMRLDFPPITLDTLQEYLRTYDKQLDEKCKDLYTERFLRILRVCENSRFWYIKSMVWAEMRKSTSYQVDISVDENGMIAEAQCECGAGQGPTAHCKHVAAVLYGITCFRTDGEILTELTCTQQLQSFHRGKPYTGSPMKSSDLPTIRKRQNPVYDPRPAKYVKREGFQDDFRNICLTQQSSVRLPVKQLFPPANPHAALMDHDYVKHPQEKFLEENKISHITAEEAAKIQLKTVGQTTNKAWKEEKRKRLTSSNFGTICKATDRKDKNAFAASLTKAKDLRSKSIMHGCKYESVAARKYEVKYGVSTMECGLFVSTDRPYLAASPDRVLKDRLLEVKCPYTARDKTISPATVPYLKKENDVLVLDKKHDYYYQVQGQMYCAGYDMCDFAVYTHEDFQVIPIQRNDQFIKDMIESLDIFYEKFFYDAVMNTFLYRNYYNFSFHSK